MLLFLGAFQPPGAQQGVVVLQRPPAPVAVVLPVIGQTSLGAIPTVELVSWAGVVSRLVHLDVEGTSKELLHQLSYAIKNQLVASKAPY